MKVHKDLQRAVDKLIALGGSMELRGRSIHAYAPDRTHLLAFSVAPRNVQSTRQQLETRIRRLSRG